MTAYILLIVYVGTASPHFGLEKVESIRFDDVSACENAKAAIESKIPEFRSLSPTVHLTCIPARGAKEQ